MHAHRASLDSAGEDRAGEAPVRPQVYRLKANYGVLNVFSSAYSADDPRFMPHDLPKSYEPGAIEARWAEYWVKEKLFSAPTPGEGDTRPVFTICCRRRM